MLTEFDRIKLAECIRDLLSERGETRSVESVLQQARKAGRQSGLGLDEFLQAWEQELLGSNPNPEEWDTDD